MAATRRPAAPNISSGRRRYLQYLYGNHYWIPETMANFSKGMVRDTAREAIPPGAVYDSADYLLHQPGVAQKRGGTTYAMSGTFGGSAAYNVLSAPFSTATPLLLACASDQHAYTVTAGAPTDLGALSTNAMLLKPTMSPGATYAIFPGSTTQKFNGTGSLTNLTGVALALAHVVSYKSRLVASSLSTPNRLYFSPTPDVNSTWDTTNSYIDCDYAISGLAALNTALLIFSATGMERIIGATPPPNSDMDRAPVTNIGCTDCRSIVTVGPYVYYANPYGVFLTNGTTPVDLTAQGGISNYWRSLFSGYISAAPIPPHTGGGGTIPSSWTISAGYFRGFLFVSVLNDSLVLQASLMCNVATRAWWRITNTAAMQYATSVTGDEFYYANADIGKVTTMSGIFSPAAGNKNDANGTAVKPTIEFAPFGSGPGVKSYGFGRLDYDMRDAASDNPVMAVTVKRGIEADTTATPAESPLVETTTLARKRFTISCESQAVTVALAQTNASAKTELYALEVESRPQSLVGDGVS